MLLEYVKKKEFLQRLYSLVFVVCFVSVPLNAQVPDVDHTKTVNTATGEMGMSIPLGVVKGIGQGHDFPILLNYQAGIRTSQEASPVGLGFSYDVGSITRKVVFVPDDCPGSSALEFAFEGEPVGLELGIRAFYRLIAIVVTTVIGIVITIVTHGAGLPLWVGGIFTAVATLNINAVQQIMFAPPDFNTGGSHTPVYEYNSNDKKGVTIQVVS